MNVIMIKSLYVVTYAFLLNIAYSQNVLSNGCLSETDDVSYPNTIRSDLYKGEQAFAVSVLNAINKVTPNENIFFSPYSTYHALLLAYFGARNETEGQLLTALNLQWAKNKNHIRQAYRIEKVQRLMRSRDSKISFAAADRIFFTQDAILHDCMKDLFYDELEIMDFRRHPEESRKIINNWIANVTRNEILEVLNESDIDSETNLVLANAAYFKGQWDSKFDAADTTKEPFYPIPNKQVFVDMMHKRGTYNIAVDEYLGAQVLEMPYLNGKESDTSMIIILPTSATNGLEYVLERFSPDSLNHALKESMAREVDVSLPKFEFEQNIELLPILNSIGISKLFTPSADLSGFSINKKLSLGDAKHVAKIKVDEEGSTAAAATVLFSFRSARPLDPTKFECTHPFLFLIYDRRTQAILFTGIYRNPNIL